MITQLILITKKLYSTLLILLFTVLLCFSGVSLSWSAELKFKTVEKDGGKQLALVIDRAEKLAGLKVTMNYNPKLLSFGSVTKSSATASFLHVVNDKIPGKIIIVMASGKGISGDDSVLFFMEFSKVENDAAEKPELTVTQLQLMDENLKEISGNFSQFDF